MYYSTNLNWCLCGIHPKLKSALGKLWILHYKNHPIPLQLVSSSQLWYGSCFSVSSPSVVYEVSRNKSLAPKYDCISWIWRPVKTTWDVTGRLLFLVLGSCHVWILLRSMGWGQVKLKLGSDRSRVSIITGLGGLISYCWEFYVCVALERWFPIIFCLPTTPPPGN